MIGWKFAKAAWGAIRRIVVSPLALLAMFFESTFFRRLHQKYYDASKQIVLSLILLAAALYYPFAWAHQHTLGYDWKPCYEAALGNFTYQPANTTLHWSYHHWVAIIYKPFALLGEDWGFLAWYCISVGCIAAIVWRCMKLRYGWIPALLCIYAGRMNLAIGQINPLLAFLSLGMIGSWFPILVKPYLALLYVANMFVRRYFGWTFIWCASLLLILAVILGWPIPNQPLANRGLAAILRKQNLIYISVLWIIMARPVKLDLPWKR